MTVAAQIAPRAFTSDVGDAEAEARRLCEAAADATSAPGQSLLIRIGTRYTTAARADGRRMVGFRIVSHVPVMLAASQAAAAGASGGAAARVLRAAAEQIAERARLETLLGAACPVVVGTAGIARAVITLGSAGGHKASVKQIQAATDVLGIEWVDGRGAGRSQDWIEPMMVGAAVLGAVLERLGAREILAEVGDPFERTLEVG
jgi:hypothetical protein